MSTSRFTIGSVLGMVSSTANAGTSMITSVAKGADMLSAFVDKQAKEQEYRYKLEHKVFKESTKVELALQLANTSAEVDKQKKKSVEFEQAFNKFYSMLDQDNE